MILGHWIEYDSNSETDSVKEIGDRNMSVIICSNRMGSNVLAEGSDQNENSREHGPDDVHERNEDPEWSIIAKFSIFLLVENQRKHYLKKACVENNGYDVVNWQNLFLVETQSNGPNNAN